MVLFLFVLIRDSWTRMCMNEPLDEQLEHIVHEFITEVLSPEDIAHLVSRCHAYIRLSTAWSSGTEPSTLEV